MSEIPSQSTPQIGSPKSILKKSKRGQKRDQSISIASLSGDDGPKKVSRDKRMMDSFSLGNGSLGNLRKSIAMKKQMAKSGIQFNDNVDVMRISFMSNSVADICFWTDDELADFRHEAFMEECGLNSEDFE
mmetsp:Transcript_17920/g.50848  ORF Transcript_17920/g.50848 Transcript_17920/m.50848 type:complete len:131 (-) Transcript_17920:3480-3872(-)